MDPILGAEGGILHIQFYGQTGYIAAIFVDDNHKSYIYQDETRIYGIWQQAILIHSPMSVYIDLKRITISQWSFRIDVIFDTMNIDGSTPLMCNGWLL